MAEDKKNYQYEKGSPRIQLWQYLNSMCCLMVQEERSMALDYKAWSDQRQSSREGVIAPPKPLRLLHGAALNRVLSK